MDTIQKAVVTGVFPNEGYISTESVKDHSSITVSLKGWNEKHLPENGDYVILGGVVLNTKGWRAKTACFFNPETQGLLLPRDYPNTVLGKILRKWDPVFFLSVYDEEWEQLIKNYAPDASALTNRLGMHLVAKRELRDPIIARILLLMFSVDIREMPFSLPERPIPISMYDIVKIDEKVNVWPPFLWENNEGLIHGPYNLLELLSAQFKKFACEIIIEYFDALLVVQEQEIKSTTRGFRSNKLLSCETKIRWYLRMMPHIVSSFNRSSSELLPTLIDMYDLSFLYRWDKAQPFSVMVESIPDIRLSDSLFEQMEGIITNCQYSNYSWKIQHLSEYVSVLAPKNRRIRGWNEHLWKRVLEFLIAQKAPYQVFDLENISQNLLKPDPGWDYEVVFSLLTVLTEYLVINNSSWVIIDKHSYAISKWVIANTHPENEDLKTLVKTFSNRF